MIRSVNQFLEKGMPVITPLSVITGVLLADLFISWVYIVPWIFAFITMSSSIGVKIEKIKHALVHPLPIFLALFIIQVMMPAIAYFSGHLFFPNDQWTLVGLVIAFVIPTGVISIMWVSIYQGNASLTLLIVLVNTLLSPIFIPLTLHLFVGESVEVNTLHLMNSLFLMIVIPSLLGVLLNYVPISKGFDLKASLAPFTKIGLFLVIAINSSVAAPLLKVIDWKLISIALVVFLLATLAYVCSYVMTKLLKFENDVMISLFFNSGMRNIGVGATIAILYFPPPVSVPVVLGMLFQQMLASVYGKALYTSLFRRSEGTLMSVSNNVLEKEQ